MVRVITYAILGGILALVVNVLFLHLFDNLSLIAIIAIGAVVGAVLGVILNGRNRKTNPGQ